MYQTLYQTLYQAMQDWEAFYYKEASRVLYGHGRYRSAISHEHFFVIPTKWFQWSKQSTQQQFQQFLAYLPRSMELYEKPSDAEKKGDAGAKSQRNLFLFINRRCQNNRLTTLRSNE